MTLSLLSNTDIIEYHKIKRNKKMTKKIIIGIGIVVMLLLSGCAPARPNFSHTKIDFVNGKGYHIPGSTCWTKEDPERITAVKAGICKEDGIMWLSREYIRKYNFTCGSGVSDVIRSHAETIKQNKSTGLTGCVYPLSDQEYNYRLNQSTQRSADARASKQRTSNDWNTLSTNNAILGNALMPKTYNVNMYHY